LLAANENLLVRLVRDDCAAGAFAAVTPVYASGDSVGTNVNSTVTVNFVDINRTPGTICIYRVEVAEPAAGGNVSEINPIINAIQTGSSLRLMLIPTG
jgi:hypothetical protein